MRRTEFFFLFLIFCFPVFLFAGEEFLFQRAEKAYQRGDLETAEKLFTSLIERYPKGGHAVNARLRIIECGNDYFDTVVGLKKLLQDYPDYKEADMIHYRLGQLYYLHNNYTDALEQWSSVISNFPSGSFYFASLFWIGNIHFFRSDYDQARQVYLMIRSSKDYNEYQSRASLRLADLLFARENWYSAITNYKAVRSDYPADDVQVQSAFFLGECYMAVQEFRQAYTWYITVREDYPDSEFSFLASEKIQFLKRKYPLLTARVEREKKSSQGGRSNPDKEWFTVQVGSFSSLRAANEYRLFLKKLGYYSFFVSVEDGDRILYRVNVGKYSVKDKAVEVKKQLLERDKVEGFVAPGTGSR